MSDLANKTCQACSGDVPALTHDEQQVFLQELGGGWEIDRAHHLVKEFRFDDFVTALGFVNQVGAVAELEGHHPDLFLTWGKVRVFIYTHKVDGLTESDFVLAAKIDRVFATA